MTKAIFKRQPYLIVIFWGYMFVVTLGVMNMVIGIIVERTQEACRMVLVEQEEMAKNDKMDSVVHMCDEIFGAHDRESLSVCDLEAAVNQTPSLLRDLHALDLPKGFDLSDLHIMFDEDLCGTVSKEEFEKGMFLLIFANEFQRSCCTMLAVAHMKHLQKALQKSLAPEKMLSSVKDLFERSEESAARYGLLSSGSEREQLPSGCQARDEQVLRACAATFSEAAASEPHGENERPRPDCMKAATTPTTQTAGVPFPAKCGLQGRGQRNEPARQEQPKSNGASGVALQRFPTLLRQVTTESDPQKCWPRTVL